MPDIGLRYCFYDNIYMAVPVHIFVGVGHHVTITYVYAMLLACALYLWPGQASVFHLC